MKHFKLLKAIEDNKPLALFLCSVFIAGWQMSALYSHYAPKVESNYSDVARLKTELAELKTDLAVIKSHINKPLRSNAAVLLADRDDRLKICNQRLQEVGNAVNSIFDHHQRCIERERASF